MDKVSLFAPQKKQHNLEAVREPFEATRWKKGRKYLNMNFLFRFVMFRLDYARFNVEQNIKVLKINALLMLFNAMLLFSF